MEGASGQGRWIRPDPAEAFEATVLGFAPERLTPAGFRCGVSPFWCKGPVMVVWVMWVAVLVSEACIAYWGRWLGVLAVLAAVAAGCHLGFERARKR